MLIWLKGTTWITTPSATTVCVARYGMKTYIGKSVACFLAAGAIVQISPLALAGSPFMTDDLEPIEYQHSEAYVFSTYDKGPDGSKQTQLPAFEYNTSPTEDVHLQVVVPFTNLYPPTEPRRNTTSGTQKSESSTASCMRPTLVFRLASFR